MLSLCEATKQNALTTTENAENQEQGTSTKPRNYVAAVVFGKLAVVVVFAISKICRNEGPSGQVRIQLSHKPGYQAKNNGLVIRQHTAQIFTGWRSSRKSFQGIQPIKLPFSDHVKPN